MSNRVTVYSGVFMDLLDLQSDLLCNALVRVVLVYQRRCCVFLVESLGFEFIFTSNISKKVWTFGFCSHVKYQGSVESNSTGSTRLGSD